MHFSRLLSISTWNKIAVFHKSLKLPMNSTLGKKSFTIGVLRGIILNFDGKQFEMSLGSRSKL